MTDSSKDHTPTTGHLGSTTSYVIGFILSLVFTIIPYYMVTNHLATGSALVITVLCFAVVQMLIQIFFFLHLGRGPKPFYNVVFFVATAAFITVVVGASILIMNNLYRNMSPKEITTRLAQDENIAEIGGKQTGACQGNKADHVVTISDMMMPGHIEAKRCDTLTLKSGDGDSHMIMFGQPDMPTSYGGQFDVSVRSDRSKIITLNETGEFSFYDHTNPAAVGHLTVEP